MINGSILKFAMCDTFIYLIWGKTYIMNKKMAISETIIAWANIISSLIAFGSVLDLYGYNVPFYFLLTCTATYSLIKYYEKDS
jgi:hypothetical protein